MTRKILAPAGVAKPGAAYHHGLLISSPTQFARLSGQIGVRLDGSVPEDFTAQADQAWDNVVAILAEAGMTLADVCKVTSYIAGQAHIGAYVAVHHRRTAGHAPPWTLVQVEAIGGGAYLVEVDVEAMR